ncbi:3-isopropylmalate dehydrogenase [Gracilariopsis chorda]|uniref:3-isopropylmalate dehydrogenase n=1 Tax=Gracilariopsis chorda TaxID=448386 RepID=A0A2V3J0G6_9FLOR|nr:3-isopropylmalate dehydrogenase [Gracilariopsis chorda]|eukprot:PXF47417.1 3-isopropylmalate dehydrogenase [Gracilariopsis chorda]
MGPVKGSSSNPYKIAILSGDGAGPTMADAAVRVLQELTSYAEIHFDFQYADYGASAYEKSGKLVTPETVEICRESDAVLRSYQGLARGKGKDGSAHLQLRDELGLFAQYRPVIIYPALAGQSTLRKEIVTNVDIMLVREISAGALGAESIVKEESQVSEIRYSKDQISAIASAALQIALQRNGDILNVDKADALSISRFWRRIVHETIESEAKGNDRVRLNDMYVDDFVREIILRPGDFDVIVTSNLFGDILAEVIAALAGPLRYSPSYWVNREGLGVFGPADIYNASAYPDENEVASPIALIRSASMMLRYALEEPAAANIIQTALRKSMEELVVPPLNGNGQPSMGASEYTDIVTRSMQLMRQFEQVCDPTECGE